MEFGMAELDHGARAKDRPRGNDFADCCTLCTCMARRQRITDSVVNDCSTGTSQGNASHSSVGGFGRPRSDTASSAWTHGALSRPGIRIAAVTQDLLDMLEPTSWRTPICCGRAYKFEIDWGIDSLPALFAVSEHPAAQHRHMLGERSKRQRR